MGLYHSTDVDGITILNPTRHQMRALIESVNDPENLESEHPDVSLMDDDSGFAISIYPGGVATLDNFKDPDDLPRFLTGLSPERSLELWNLLVDGHFVDLLNLPWQSESP